MQMLPRYLVSNRVTLIANVAGFITEYRPVYSRTLQVYKGIDNVLEFRLMNGDQRPINTADYSPVLVAFDENNNMVVERDAVVLDDGSSATKGLFTVTITENDLLNVKQQYLKYNVYMVDNNNNKVLTYSHSNFDNDATIYVNGRTFPGPRKSTELTLFSVTSANSNIWNSETISAYPGINGNEALHTAAVYTNMFIGDLVLQATLDPVANESTSWATIATHTFTGSETAPVPLNFNGVFTHLRFSTTSDPADTITKILIRN